MTLASREDGMMSVLGALARHTGMGLSALTAAEAYRAHGLAAAIVDRPAEDALARGIVLADDPDGRVAAEMERLDAAHVAIEALRCALLSGAAAILPLADDAPDLLAPMDAGRLRRVTALNVYAADMIFAGPERINDPASPFHGEPSSYTLRPANGGAAFDVHHSRLLRVPGEPLPLTVLNAAGGFRLPWMGRPVLEGCMRSLSDYAEARRILLRVLERKQSPVLRMQGLGELLSTQGLDGEAIVQRRLALVDAMRSLLNTVAVDKDDDFTVTDLSVTGLDSALNEFRVALAADARIPVSVLFGEPSKGLGSTGQGELQVYHGRVETLRARSVRPALTALARLLAAQQGMPAAPGLAVSFPPLWSPSAKELAEADRIGAEADKVRAETLGELIALGVLLPDDAPAAATRLMPRFVGADAT